MQLYEQKGNIVSAAKARKLLQELNASGPSNLGEHPDGGGS